MKPKREAVADGAQQQAPERLIPIAQVMGSHGVRGGLRVKVFNDDSDLLAALEQVWLRAHDGTLRAYELRSAQPVAKGWLVGVRGIDTPEAAKQLHGAELCVARHELPPLAAGEFYFVDLPGLEVVLPDGSVVGRALGVIEYPASDVLRVELAAGGFVEVPLIEPYLVSVDVAAGRAVVDQIAELDVEKPKS